MIEKYIAALRENIDWLKSMIQEAHLPEGTSDAILAKLDTMEQIISTYE